MHQFLQFFRQVFLVRGLKLHAFVLDRAFEDGDFPEKAFLLVIEKGVQGFKQGELPHLFLNRLEFFLQFRLGHPLLPEEFAQVLDGLGIAADGVVNLAGLGEINGRVLPAEKHELSRLGLGQLL